MAKRTFILVLLTAWLLASSVGARGRDVRLGEQFDLTVDQVATVSGEGLQIGFADVVSDSRCPRDVQCFWAGVATVRLSVEKAPNGRTMLTLRTPSESAAGTYGNYSVSLVDLKPYPERDRRQRREDYVATVIVTRVE